MLVKQLRRFEREVLDRRRRRSTKKSVMSERGLRRRTSAGVRKGSHGGLHDAGAATSRHNM